MLQCIPLVAAQTFNNPILDNNDEVPSETMLHPFLSPYAHLSIPGFLVLGLVLPCVVPHLGGYCALGSLVEALTWGLPALSAVSGFDSSFLYQNVLIWLGHKPYTMKGSTDQPLAVKTSLIDTELTGQIVISLLLFIISLFCLYIIKSFITKDSPFNLEIPLYLKIL